MGVPHALAAFLVGKKLFELRFKGRGNHLFDARFVVHEKVGAGNHDSKGRAEQRKKKRDAAYKGAPERNPSSLLKMGKVTDFAKSQRRS